MKIIASYWDESWGKYWDEAHAKDPNNYKAARVIIYAPDESDLYEITLCCIKTLCNNGSWDFEIEPVKNDHKNIVTFKYNGTITSLNAVSELNFHCDHSIKWEFIK